MLLTVSGLGHIEGLMMQGRSYLGPFIQTYINFDK